LRTIKLIGMAGGGSVLLLAGLACFNTNPFRAGEKAGSSIIDIPHDVQFNGIGHAQGMCDPLNNCAACHGANLQGGSSGQPSCTQCHGALWTLPNCGQNNHTVNLGGIMHAPNYCHPLAHCTACHGASLGGGTNGQPSCYSCHEAKWNSSGCGNDIHTVNLGGMYHAPNYCRPYQNCAACHGSVLHGGTGGEPSCWQCHDQNAWKNCASNPHNHSMEGVMHAPGYCQPYANCAFCHGDQLQGGPNHEPKCTQCHGQVWNDCGGDDVIQ
jgi:hypothetical protein